MAKIKTVKFEKERWIKKYNELALRISHPEYKWRTGSLKQVKERFRVLYCSYLKLKHLL